MRKAAFRTIPILLVAAAWSTLAPAQEPQPPGDQLPPDLRGAKVYQLPEKMQPGQAAENPVIYKQLAYQDISLERLVLKLHLSVKPVDRAATIRRVHFQDFRVNGMPVHIEPFEQEFKLSTKTTVDLPAPLKCSIIYSDLESVALLKESVERDSLRITGRSFIEVKLNVLEKMAMRARRLVIPAEVSEEVPLQMFSGNPLLKMAATRILDTLADPTSQAAMALAREHVAKLAGERALASLGRASLYLLHCEYELHDPRSGVAEKFSQSGTGFVVSADGKLLTAKRVVQPWKFDPQAAFLMKRHDLKLNEASYRLSAWPAGVRLLAPDGQLDSETAFSTEKKTLEIAKTAPDRMEKQNYRDPDSSEEASVNLHRAGEDDVALLRLVGSGFEPLTLAESSAAATPGSRTALLGFPFGLGQALVEPKPGYVSAKADGAWIRLERRVNPGESGAPLVTAEGQVLAMSAGESECIPVEALRNLVK